MSSNRDTDYHIIAKYLSGECSAAERLEVERKLKSDDSFKQVVEGFKVVWNSKTRSNIKWDAEGTWDRLSRNLDREEQMAIKRNSKRIPASYRESKKIGSALLRIAAVLAVSVLAGVFTATYLSMDAESGGPVVKEMVTEKGQRGEVRLSDGSRIYLNSESRLVHPTEFKEDIRSVEISGEAYFEIANDGRPFVVYANNAVIEVLGTEFNVYSYQDEEDLQVAVTEGRVSVGYRDETESDKAYLKEGDMAYLNQHNRELVVLNEADLDRHVEWLDNRITFEDEPIERAVDKIERWYGVEIEFVDIDSRNLRISAVFEDESIHEVLRVLSLSLGLEYSMDNNQITFFPEGENKDSESRSN